MDELGNAKRLPRCHRVHNAAAAKPCAGWSKSTRDAAAAAALLPAIIHNIHVAMYARAVARMEYSALILPCCVSNGKHHILATPSHCLAKCAFYGGVVHCTDAQRGVSTTSQSTHTHMQWHTIYKVIFDILNDSSALAYGGWCALASKQCQQQYRQQRWSKWNRSEKKQGHAAPLSATLLENVPTPRAPSTTMSLCLVVLRGVPGELEAGELSSMMCFACSKLKC